MQEIYLLADQTPMKIHFEDRTKEIIENEAEKDTDGKLKEILKDMRMLKMSNGSNQIPMRKETGSEAANEENGWAFPRIDERHQSKDSEDLTNPKQIHRKTS